MAERVKYVCTECAVHTVKLWRKIHSGDTLLCVDCSCKWVGMDPGTVNGAGKNRSALDSQWSDQFYNPKNGRSLLPAVPDDTWTTFWGYTSVPPDGCAWWGYMPLRSK